MKFGEKILESVKASIDVVGCNTNLGIILLCVPIVEAIYLDKDHKFKQSNLKIVLDGINIEQTKKILITGHTGFKGSWLSAWLLMLGSEVCGYSKDVPTNPSNLFIFKQFKYPFSAAI